eukprot:684364-Ditylum_brightwellii.AAC.1
MLLVYHDFSMSFNIHMDGSDAQLGAVISQCGMPITFYLHELNNMQKNYTTIERELLAIVEALKDF